MVSDEAIKAALRQGCLTNSMSNHEWMRGVLNAAAAIDGNVQWNAALDKAYNSGDHLNCGPYRTMSASIEADARRLAINTFKASILALKRN